jgi:hypothetical protein
VGVERGPTQWWARCFAMKRPRAGSNAAGGAA